MTRLLLAIATAMLLASSCSTSQKAPEPAPAPKPTIDYDDLQHRLEIFMDPEETGFREKRFDACDLGEGLAALQPRLPDCHHAVFTLIQYRLSCRAEESSSGILSQSDLTPIANRKLTVSLDRIRATSTTDEQGRGTIRAVSASSLKRAHLKLSTGVDFLVVRANEITEVATPPDWCR